MSMACMHACKLTPHVQAAGIEGKDVTPFLLKRVADATKGRSLESNIALVQTHVLFLCPQLSLMHVIPPLCRHGCPSLSPICLVSHFLTARADQAQRGGGGADCMLPCGAVVRTPHPRQRRVHRGHAP